MVAFAGPTSYPELGPDGRLDCTACPATYPFIGGTARILRGSHRARLPEDYPGYFSAGPAAASDVPDTESALKQKTADSFAYEWRVFGGLRDEWRANFLGYMRPHEADFFAGKSLLDVGTGSGRHSHQAALLGAEVAAVDLGGSIDVARRNLPAEVLTVQADAEDLPFEPASFDMVMSIGVLHHLPDPYRGFMSIVEYAKPGGHVHVYVYWQPPLAAHRRILAAVTSLRRLTVRLPHRLLHLLCYPLAAALYATVVLPYRALRHRRRGRAIAECLPLKAYADYPFAVCVNDQFDRFSAPIENRYTRQEVEAWLRDAGLEEVQVLPHHGWIADGRRRASRTA